jgi:hypothetical protein
MVSILSHATRKQHSLLWLFTKYTCVMLTILVIYLLNVHPRLETHFSFLHVESTDPISSYQAYDRGNDRGYEASLLFHNNGSGNIERRCHVKNVSIDMACAYARETDECNKYIILHYCYMQNIQPLYYLVLVSFFLIHFPSLSGYSFCSTSWVIQHNPILSHH